MLWNSIYDFFVMYVFGGLDSQGQWHYLEGGLVNHYLENEFDETLDYNDFVFKIGDIRNGDFFTISISNYLSLIATIISISIIVVLCCLFIKKIVSLVGGLIRQ